MVEKRSASGLSWFFANFLLGIGILGLLMAGFLFVQVDADLAAIHEQAAKTRAFYPDVGLLGFVEVEFIAFIGFLLSLPILLAGFLWRRRLTRLRKNQQEPVQPGPLPSNSQKE